MFKTTTSTAPSVTMADPNLSVSPTYTISSPTTAASMVWQSTNNWTADTSINAGGHLELRGEKADVVINGVSLKETLEGIQARLNILRPNPALEAEWDELQALGEQYRRLEAQLLEKQRSWEILKRQE
jgi:hypothetical protein